MKDAFSRLVLYEQAALVEALFSASFASVNEKTFNEKSFNFNCIKKYININIKQCMCPITFPAPHQKD